MYYYHHNIDSENDDSDEDYDFLDVNSNAFQRRKYRREYNTNSYDVYLEQGFILFRLLMNQE